MSVLCDWLSHSIQSLRFIHVASMRPSRLLKASNTQFFINTGSFSSLVNGYHTAALLWLRTWSNSGSHPS